MWPFIKALRLLLECIIKSWRLSCRPVVLRGTPTSPRVRAFHCDDWNRPHDLNIGNSGFPENLFFSRRTLKQVQCGAQNAAAVANEDILKRGHLLARASALAQSPSIELPGEGKVAGPIMLRYFIITSLIKHLTIFTEEAKRSISDVLIPLGL